MKIFIEGATKEQAPAHAKAIIDGKAEQGIILALVKVVRLAKGILLFFDRDEWEKWAADKKATKGIYKGEKAA